MAKFNKRTYYSQGESGAFPLNKEWGNDLENRIANAINDTMAGYGEKAAEVTGDWNTACGDKSGFFMGQNLTNQPTGVTTSNWWYVIQLVHNSLFKKQIAFSFVNTNNSLYVRNCLGNEWSSWTEASTKENTSGIPTYNSEYFSDVKRNNYVRNGNTVQLSFIGYTSKAIPNGTVILSNLPTNALSGLRIVTYTSTYEYIKEAIGGNCYFGSYDSKIKSFGESAGKWVHIDVTYITSD